MFGKRGNSEADVEGIERKGRLEGGRKEIEKI